MPGSNHGNILSTNSSLLRTAILDLPPRSSSLTQSMNPSSAPVPSTCGFARMTTASPLLMCVGISRDSSTRDCMQPPRLAPSTSTTGTAETRGRWRRDPTSCAFMILSLGGGATELDSRGSAPSMPPARRRYDRGLQNVVPTRRWPATGSARATAPADRRGRRCHRVRLQLELKLRAREPRRSKQCAVQRDVAR